MSDTDQQTMNRSAPELTVNSSPISDASARVRIALRLKKLPFQTISINLRRGENGTDEFAAVNPAQAVPALIVEQGSHREVLVQSNAILEYLEEAFPETTPLLPNQPLLRATVRRLVGVIATDIHPLTTHRVGNELLRRQTTSVLEWRVYWIERGLRIYEAIIKETAGLYSVGDSATLADVYLAPQIWTAIRMGVPLDGFPIILKAYANLMTVAAIREEMHNPQLEL